RGISCVPKRAPLAQKSPGNCPTVAVEIGQGALSLLMSMIDGFFHFCGAQSLAVCSDMLIARSSLTGAPVRKFVCSCGIGTPKIGMKLCPPSWGFIVM